MDTIAVWFSCGAASAVAAKKTIEIYGGTHRVRVINNPIDEEHGDNKRFLLDVQNWLGVEIEFAINPKFPNHSIVEVWEKSQAMSFPWGRTLHRQAKEASSAILGKGKRLSRHGSRFYRRRAKAPYWSKRIGNITSHSCFD